MLVAAALALSHSPMIRDRTREGCFRAFRHNNWLGAAVFAGILADGFPWQSLLGGTSP